MLQRFGGVALYQQIRKSITHKPTSRPFLTKLLSGVSSIISRWKAEQGDPQAQYNYATQLRCQRNPEYYKYYKLSADQGNVQAQYRLATLYVSKDDPESMNEAIRYFQMAAQNNHPQASRVLGYYLLVGNGVRQNTRDSIKYFKAAAELGDHSANYTLAVYHYSKQQFRRAAKYASFDPNNSHSPLSHYLYSQIYWKVNLEDKEFTRETLKNYVRLLVRAADLNYQVAQEKLVCIHHEYIYEYPVVSRSRLLRYSSYLASLGNPWGFMGLGFYYWTESLEDRLQAVFYFKKAGVQLPDAEWYLFQVLHSDANTPSKIEEAYYYLKRAADRESLRACDYISQCYFYGSHFPMDYVRGLYYGFKAGDTATSNVLASIGSQFFGYDEKEIVRNYHFAAQYMSAAASMGNSGGLYGMAFCYLYGYGVPQDYFQAWIHLHGAIDLGESVAMLVLARTYQEADPSMYGALLRLAADYGNADAQYELSQYVFGLDLHEDKTEAYKNLVAAADSGSTEYQLQLADHCSNPESPNYSLEVASDYYFRAAVNGNATAAFKLAELISSEKCPESDSSAEELYYWAASAGHADAQLALGLMHLEGIKVPQDEHLALNYISGAANQGLKSAQYHLGLLYSRGIGVGKSVTQSEFLFELASGAHADPEPVDEARYMI